MIRENLRSDDGNERAARDNGDLPEPRRPFPSRRPEEAPPAPPVLIEAPTTFPAVEAPPLAPVPTRPISFEPRPFPFPFPLPLPLPLPPVVPKSVTQLAQGAANQLRATEPPILQEAITTIINTSVIANGLMHYLERKVLIGEVLNRLAANWPGEVRQDFAGAFSMGLDRLAVMDTIVSIAVLNDPDLPRELRAENTPAPTQDDLIERRRVVAQYPPAGTPVQPGQLVLVAVEFEETALAEQVVQSIIGDLVDHQGFKLPSVAAQKLLS
jgi:hypothetical protein